MTKKAHIVTQIFIYMASAAVFLSILIFGYKAILGLIHNQDTAVLTDFTTDLQNTVEKLKLRRGSVDIKTFRLPSKFTKVCFYDSDYLSHLNSNSLHQQFDSAWKTGSENVFLLPKQEVPILIKDIEINNEGNPFFCMNIDRKFSLRFEGKGKRVSISEQTS